MDQIVRVNRADLSSHSEPVSPAWGPLGGRALTSTIVAAEVPPTGHPFGPNNQLVFAPGLLTGTADDVTAQGKSVLKTERPFNLNTGLSKEHDHLSEFFSLAPVPPRNAIWDFTDQELDVYWAF